MASTKCIATLQDLIRQALLNRKDLRARLIAEETHCCRLFDGGGDGDVSLTIDLMGTLLLVRYHASEHEDCRGVERLLAEVAEDIQGVTHCYLWIERGARKVEGSFLFGCAQSDFEVLESGVRYVVRPASTPSGGLFLDMREVRAWLRQNCGGARMLNTFCFTGSLGIAAAIGGAKEVVQVDIQKSILSWVRDNMALNHVSDGMRLICEDTLSFMRREARRISQGRAAYDFVVIDPPTFGSSAKRVFRLEQSVPELLELGAQVLGEDGVLIFTSNTLGLDHKKLLKAAERSGLFSFDSFVVPPQEDFPSNPRASGNMRGVRLRKKASM